MTFESKVKVKVSLFMSNDSLPLVSLTLLYRVLVFRTMISLLCR